MKPDFRREIVIILSEGIRVLLSDHGFAPFVAVYVYYFALEIVERTDIIQATYVVPMAMCDEQCIDSLDMVVQHLIAKVRPGIYDEYLAIDLDHGRRAQPVVPGVSGYAYFAAAAYERHTTRSPCTKKSNSHMANIEL
jgi:hypothetical protein